MVAHQTDYFPGKPGQISLNSIDYRLHFQHVDVIVSLGQRPLTADAVIAQLCSSPRQYLHQSVYSITSVSDILRGKLRQTAGEAHHANWWNTWSGTWIHLEQSSVVSSHASIAHHVIVIGQKCNLSLRTSGAMKWMVPIILCRSNTEMFTASHQWSRMLLTFCSHFW